MSELASPFNGILVKHFCMPKIHHQNQRDPCLKCLLAHFFCSARSQTRGATFELEYLRELETEFKNYVEYESRLHAGSIHEKPEAKKIVVVPLKGVLFNKFGNVVLCQNSRCIVINPYIVKRVIPAKFICGNLSNLATIICLFLRRTESFWVILFYFIFCISKALDAAKLNKRLEDFLAPRGLEWRNPKVNFTELDIQAKLTGHRKFP
jgi:hypothetical protein